jgi:hypothetical protein
MAAMEICKSLSIHAQIEEEIFYPACDAQVEDAADLLAEARVEHQSLRDLISKIEDGRAGDDRFDAEVKVLGEFTRHHVREEQNELFPKVHKSDLDRAEIGRLLARRKAELMAEAGPDRTAMSKGTAEAQKHQKSQKKLDHELKESFPASDPPAATIPTIADRGPRK